MSYLQIGLWCYICIGGISISIEPSDLVFEGPTKPGPSVVTALDRRFTVESAIYEAYDPRHLTRQPDQAFCNGSDLAVDAWKQGSQVHFKSEHILGRFGPLRVSTTVSDRKFTQ